MPQRKAATSRKAQPRAAGPPDLQLDICVDPAAPPRDYLTPLVRLLRRLRDRERQEHTEAAGRAPEIGHRG